MDGLITWFANILASWGMANADQTAAIIIWVVYGMILSLMLPLVAMVLLTWLERKILARIQDRIGPNRAGPFGLLQAIADTIKMFTKEDITPAGADRLPYNAAPALVAISVILVFAVMPFAPGVIGADLSIGVFYVMAVGAFGILATLMAGWSSNNKYALLGAFRAVAQLVAYEIPMVISLITVTLVAGSMSMLAIIDGQSLANGGWYVIAMPTVFLIFFISSVAEVGRSPFDLLEAESELVAGFHVEYSGLKFGFFMIGEYLHMFAVAGLVATLFLGGWRGPFIEQAVAVSPFLGALLGAVYFFAKLFFFVFVMIWMRGTLLRFRIDHLLDFGWKFLTPLSLVLLLVVAFVVKLFQPAVTSQFTGMTVPAGPLVGLGAPGLTVALLVSNILVAVLASWAVRAFARRSRAAGFRALSAVEN